MQQKLQQIPQLRQELRLSQTLIQSLEILQLPTPELEARLRQEAEVNPFLELEDKNKISYEEISSDEEDYTKMLHPYNKYDTTLPIDLSKNPEVQIPINIISVTPSLTQHLIEQLKYNTDDPKVIEIGEAIIANIDKKGYLSATTEELSHSLNVPKEEVEKVLELIQKFDPPGVGARDPRECLLLQAKIIFPENTLLIKLLEEHYDDFLNKRKTKIAKELGISIEQVERLYEFVKEHLNPHPGFQYPEPPDYIQPDLIVRETEDGNYTVELVDYYLPRVKLVETIKNDDLKKLTKDEKNIVKDWKDTAQFLVRSLELRKETLLKVGEEIVKRQQDFMKKGISQLKPMTYRDIAETTGLHESTISRCVTGKWIQTPQGMYELKFFFTRGLESTKINGEAISSEAIKNAISEIIEQEDKNKPLSDEKISEILKEKLGVKVARRTVAKYREELKIPNSSERKQYK